MLHACDYAMVLEKRGLDSKRVWSVVLTLGVSRNVSNGNLGSWCWLLTHGPQRPERRKAWKCINLEDYARAIFALVSVRFYSDLGVREVCSTSSSSSSSSASSASSHKRAFMVRSTFISPRAKRWHPGYCGELDLQPGETTIMDRWQKPRPAKSFSPSFGALRNDSVL